MYCLPISNVVTERSAPNADGIEPTKALFPDDMNVINTLSNNPYQIMYKHHY